MVSAVAICMSSRRVWHRCNLPCVYALFRLISVARYAFKSPRICFRGTNYEINREHAAYLHSISFAKPGCDYKCLQLQFRACVHCVYSRSRSVGRSLITDNIFCSRTIVLGDAVAFLRESYPFVYIMFLAAIFLLLDVLVYSSCSCLRTMQACWLFACLRVCLATVWLSSGFVLWLAYLIG